MSGRYDPTKQFDHAIATLDARRDLSDAEKQAVATLAVAAAIMRLADVMEAR